jgi:hypothetical protein
MYQYGFINVDFKWWNGQVYMLEMDDAINSSGFNGYNVLYSSRHVSGDEVMLRNMTSYLQTKFSTIHFIFNGLPHNQWPTEQILNVQYYETVFDFLRFAQPRPKNFANDILLLGYARENLQAEPYRNATEMQEWLLQLGINIPVINAASMIDATDDKLLFNLAIKSYKPETFVININTFSCDITTALRQCHADKFVLKPVDASQGRGVVLLSRQELETHYYALAHYLAQRSKEILLLDVFDDYRKNKITELHQFAYRNNCQTILLQAYIASDFLRHNEADYDPTGRVVLFLSKTETTCHIKVIDGYWKLPEKPISIDADTEISRLSHVTANTNNLATCGAAKFTLEQQLAITTKFEQMGAVLAPLLQSKTTFYLANVMQLAPAVQAYLAQYFVRELLDVFAESHLLQLSHLLPQLPGIELALLRSLAIEIGVFQYHAVRERSLAKFLHNKLLVFLAGESCPLEFTKVRYYLHSQQDISALLLQMLPTLTSKFYLTFINEAVADDAKKLIAKLNMPPAAFPALPFCITNAQSFWECLAMDYNLVPPQFLCTHSKKIMDEPVQIGSHYYDKSSVLALNLPIEQRLPATELKHDILQFLFRCAQSKSIYDNFRINFALPAEAEKARLLTLAYIFGNGVKHPLIIVGQETVSINKFWFYLQLPSERRAEIINECGLI